MPTHLLVNHSLYMFAEFLLLFFLSPFSPCSLYLSFISPPNPPYPLPQNKTPIYDFRTFEIAPVTKKTQEIPLIIYNSYFFDEKSNISRSCYGNITAEMTEEIFDILPHYYVMGITLKEIEKQHKR